MTARMCRTEHDEQVFVMAWAALNVNRFPCLRWLYAVPNGGHRHRIVAAKMKAEGVKSGVADLCLPFPAGGYHGLYLELKALNGRVSDAQVEFIEYVESVGYIGAVCYGADVAIAVIEKYLGETG